MARTYTQDEVDLMVETVARLGNRTKAAEELGIPRTTVLNYTKDKVAGSPQGGGFNPIHAGKREGREPIDVVRKAGGVAVAEPTPSMGNPPAEPEPEPTPIEWTERGNEATATFASDKLIRTEAEALEYGQIDQSIWYVKSMKIGAWPTTMRLRNGQDAERRWRPDSGHVKQNWRISLDLARIMPRSFQAAHDAIFEKMKEYAPAYPKMGRTPTSNPHLLEIDLFDVHFGKLAWRAETGQDYDLNIAANVFRNAVEDLIGYTAGIDIDAILLPIGNDFYHVDNLNSATTSGTHVDSDGRYAKIIEAGELAVIHAIEYLRTVAPVKVLWVPGNHDRVASYHLARTLAAWFRQCPDVTVDHSPKARKYFRYHKNLIGFTHGQLEPHRGLPMLMATEEPEAWAATTRREVHVGHLHHSRKTDTRSVGDQDGVSVRILQSLSGKDAYHFERGYGGRRAAEAFVYSADGGTSVNYQVAARDN